MCGTCKMVSYDWYIRHLKRYHPETLTSNKGLQENADTASKVLEESVDWDEIIPTPSNLINNHISQTLVEAKALCDNFWMSLLSQPNISQIVIDLICDNQKMIIMKMLEVLKDEPTYEQAKNEVDNLWLSNTSSYRRKKSLIESGTLILPKGFALTDRREIVTNLESERLVLKTDYMAVIPLKDILTKVLENPSIFNALKMPVDFSNENVFSHPFSGTRAQKIVEEFGENVILLQFYLDAYGASNPLRRSTASVYNVTGCYFRILNLPIILQSMTDHIFLFFLGFTKDLKEDLQSTLRYTLVNQLKNLSIDLTVNNVQHSFKVLLFNIVGDNLGLNQVGGYKEYFRGENPCRICTFSYDEVCSLFEIEDTRLRTVESYNSDNSFVKEKSALNDLEYFHVQECPSVDMMHDLLQGHLRYMIPVVLKSFANYTQVYNAIATFPFHGKEAANLPRPVQDQYLGDELKGMTAGTILNFIRFLPLILADLNPDDNNDAFKLLLLFQRILDICMSFEISENLLQRLESDIKEYLILYKELGGKMTVKPHYMLHYPMMIRMYGSLRYSWAMRYEAKHQPSIIYSGINRCFKSLCMTLASKHQFGLCEILTRMKEDNYVNQVIKNQRQQKFKRNEYVILDCQDNSPMFGRIYDVLEDNSLCIFKLITESFDQKRFCYVVQETFEAVIRRPDELYIEETMRLYNHKFIRLPYALF